MNKYIIGIGEVLWDMLPTGKKIGGAPANFAYHVSQFGFDSVVVSAVGEDLLGAEILEKFDSIDLNYEIEEIAFPTGTVQVELDEFGVPIYEIKENVAWDNILFTPNLEKLTQNTRVVCFGSLAQRNVVSRNTINSFIDKMPNGEGQYKIFDINLRQNFYKPNIIIDSLNRCNILKLNDEELIIIGSLFNYQETDLQAKCMRLLKDYKLEMVILTCGINGSYIFTKDEVSFIETPVVEVIDTVGAGDSFAAAFIASILKNDTIKQAHQKAVDISAYVCTQPGAMPNIPEELK